MELADLKTFVAVVEHHTTTKAAKILGMTQPGVSKHLSRLEYELGVPLFDRVGRNIVINEFGENLLKRTKKILDDLDSLKSCVYGASCPIGHLKIGLTDASTLLIIPTALKKFHKQYPGIHISLDVESSTVIEERVLENNYDMGIITAGLKPQPLLDEDVLYHDHIDALVYPFHPLAEKKCLLIDDLAAETIIMSPKRRRTRKIIDAVFELRNVMPKDVIDVYNNTAAMRLTAAGLGVALLPRAFITKQSQEHKCKHLRISGDPFKRTLCVVRKRGDELGSKAASLFYDMLMEQGPKMG